MHLDNERDFADARQGRIAALPNAGVVRDAAGNTVMDAGSSGFIKNLAAAPDSVNPGLWRQSQLESETGLFQVIERIYQVRGYDISGITFIEGDSPQVRKCALCLKSIGSVDPWAAGKPDDHRLM
jgi:alkyl sulfatase BDS1-like metallo-beta-lactamase superfamily hydrolase